MSTGKQDYNNNNNKIIKIKNNNNKRTNTNIDIVVYGLNKNKQIYQIEVKLVVLNRIESFSFLANRPSLVQTSTMLCSCGGFSGVFL